MSKDQMLGAIRRGLKRGPLPEDQAMALRARMAAHPRHLVPMRSQVARPAQIALFIANVEKEFGTVARVASLAEVPGAVADYLAGQNLPTDFALAPHPELTEGIPWAERPLLAVRVGRAQASDQVCVQHGYAAVAETGTLMLPAAPERPTTLNLLGDTAIVVLRASRVVGPFEDAWDLLRTERVDAVTGGFMPRNVMLVTGPSRSADIELTLELGAHGPRRLHVVLVDDDPAALRVDHPAAPAGRPDVFMPRRKGLSEADRAIWALYAQHIHVLPGRAVPELPPEVAVAQTVTRPAVAPGKRPVAAGIATLAVGNQPGGLDNSTWNKFRSGRLAAGRTLDLHGRTAQRAFHALHRFLHAAHADQVRCVEVITGRGAGEGGGVIRREFPLWLNLPALRPLVLAASHPHAANPGSVRLLLRRVR